VSPAGELTVLDTIDVGSFCSGADVGVLAADERRRQFLYYLDKRDGDATVDALRVGGHLVQTTGVPPEVLPPEVLEAGPSQERPSTASEVHN
jgi:hypothetical protein